MARNTVLLIGTRSSGKLREFAEIFDRFQLQFVDLSTAGIEPAPEEDSLEEFDTFELNALAKARHFHARSGGMQTVADDSGLVVPALDGAPGVRSKRYSGRTDLSGVELDRANNELLMAQLERRAKVAGAAGEPDVSREAHFVCAAAYVDDDAELVCTRSIPGRIVSPPRGSGGFGYDPHFESDDLAGTMAEATWQQKSRVSHRARAFGQLIELLKQRRIV